MSAKYKACASFIKGTIHTQVDHAVEKWKSEPTLGLKIMGVASSKIGMSIIASVMILGTLLPYLMSRHSISDGANSSAWNTPISDSHFQSSTSKTVKAMPPSMQSQIDLLKRNMSGMQTEINLLTKEIAQQKIVSQVKKPYQLLGVRFDDEAQQWVADVQINNKTKSVTAGEEFDGWHVGNVDSEGASIE